MHRSDGINVAVGGILVGISAVILGLLSPVTAAFVASVCGGLGLYMIVGGVYLGCWTPTTALERALRPHLKDGKAEVILVDGPYVTFQTSVRNSGRDDLNGAFLNVIVPEFVSEMHRCSAEGEIGLEEHRGSFWRRPGHERFWNGNVSFPGRNTRLIFFRVTVPEVHAFPVTLKIFSPALEVVPWVAGFELSVAGFTPSAEAPSPLSAPERGGPA